LFLGNYTDSADVQKVSEKQSVRFDDLVVAFNPKSGSDLASPWEAINSFRMAFGYINTQFGIALTEAIRAWIDVMRSGGSPSNMPLEFLLIVNRRKWAALGLMLQDAASEDVSGEDAQYAIEIWSSWDRAELEQECTDYTRSKRTQDALEREEAIRKKAKFDNRQGGGARTGAGRGRGGGGRNQPLAGRGWINTSAVANIATVSQGQVSSQVQNKAICLDNVGELMGLPGVKCGRVGSCKFPHANSLVELDRAVVERDIKGIIKHPARVQLFLTATAAHKFKGE
jgi:hypothetical protein